MQKGIDCATKLTEQSAQAIKSAGYDYAIRYLGYKDWKRLFKEEVDAIKKDGLKLVSVWEADADHESYFTYDQGKTDALFANQYAKQVGQPIGSAIYFAVDYDCHNISAVKAYFKGVKANLDKSFKVGVYGSYDVVMGLKNDVDYFFQTYAWSHGKVADHVHIYQHLNGQQVAGVQVDLDKIFKSPGHWVEPVQLDYVKPKPKPKTKPSSKAVIPYPGTLFELKHPYMEGDDVKRIQHALNVAKGHKVLDEDGKYGPLTASEVGDYQERHHLKKDEIVGINTWNTLF